MRDGHDIDIDIDMHGMTDEQADAALVLAQRDRALAEVEALRRRVAELESLHDRAGALVASLSSVDGAIGVIAQAAVPDAAFLVFTKLREKLCDADVCLACGAHTPGRTCHCENDE